MRNLLTPEPQGAFTSLWSKYRPVILQLMLSAADGPQQYKLYSHEFKALATKNATFAFVLYATKGKALNDIRKSRGAQDLMTILNLSRIASDELQKFTFEFRLDTQFMLHVARVPAS